MTCAIPLRPCCLWPGVHPKVVQDLLGHRTIVVTMDTYSHVMPVLHLQAIQTLNALLASSSSPNDGPTGDFAPPAARPQDVAQLDPTATH